MAGKEKITLKEGETYLIEGIPVIYEFTESSKHYFQKIDKDGNPQGRLRVIMGDPDQVASMLIKRAARYTTR
jgi:hypothetical protein